jgi:hypothetical protein
MCIVLAVKSIFMHSGFLANRYASTLFAHLAALWSDTGYFGFFFSAKSEERRAKTTNHK